MRKSLLAAGAAVCLFVHTQSSASHETPGGDRTLNTPLIGYSDVGEVKIPPMPKNAAAHAKDSTDIAKASNYFVIYQKSGDPAPGTYQEAWDSCNAAGDRLPTITELRALVAKGRINENFKDGCLWSATEREDNKLSMYWFEKKTGNHGTGWAQRGASCGIMCLRPADAVQDTIDMCPVGAMNYCVSGQGKITNCEGKECAPDFRCICGDFALAYGRCLRHKLAKKSWHVYSHCTKNGKDERKHETNIIQTPYTLAAHLKRFCSIEPQQVEPGGNPAFCCWLQEGDEPRVPGRCQETYCGAGETPYVEVRAEGENYYATDFTENPSCLQHFQFRTGIEGKLLTK